MSWQIVNVAVYGRGEVRRVPLWPGKINLITGRSQRGKSTLLEIVDYCLLSKSCRIPKGTVRDVVDAVGILIEDANTRMGIIRRLPAPGKITRTSCWLEQGIAELPNVLPADNQAVETAKEELSGFTGIASADVLTLDGRHEKAVVNIRHCAPYLFQHQDVIANRNLSFAGLEEHWARRHVLEGVGYFLGVLTIETLQKRSRLIALKAQFASEKRRAAERSRLSASGFERGQDLWSEAHKMGLVDTKPPTTLTRLRDGLERTAGWTSGPPLPDLAEKLRELEVREQEIARKRDALRRERESTQRYLQLSEGTAALARGGRQRLAVRHLLPQPSRGECPVCGGSLPHEKWSKQLAFAETALQEEATIDPRVASRLQRVLSRTEKEYQASLQELSRIHTQIAGVRRTLAARQTASEAESERLRLTGRVQEYLRAMAGAMLVPEADTSSLAREIAQLEGQVGDQAMRRRLEAAEVQISTAATRYALALNTEFGDSEVRLRLRDMTIQVKVGGTWTALAELGSGANWVSYHVACVLGLHEALAAGGGPVPRFLVLDQPSQAWFPPERIAVEGGVEPTGDADKLAVRRLFDVLHKFALDHKVQVVVVDHARPDLPWTTAHVAQDWHGPDALVPEQWLAQPQSP